MRPVWAGQCEDYGEEKSGPEGKEYPEGPDEVPGTVLLDAVDILDSKRLKEHDQDRVAAAFGLTVFVPRNEEENTPAPLEDDLTGTVSDAKINLCQRRLPEVGERAPE